jgi:hypothetical protein
MLTAELIIRIFAILQGVRFPLQDEKKLQKMMWQKFQESTIGHMIKREYKFDEKSIIDFLVLERVGIEVKIKGTQKDIYRQLRRYAKFAQVDAIILVTSRPMGLPNEIEGKKCYYLDISKAWL